MKRKLLFAIVALLCSVGAWAYQTPTADGIYYLYNTACTDGTPGFISRGEDYTKRAVISQFGIPIQLISTGETDTYYFQLYDSKGYLSDDGFMYTDGGIGGQPENRRRAIKVVSQGDGTYKLQNTNNNKEVEDWYGHPVGDGTGNRHNYIWQFFSPAEYEAVVAGYTQTQDLAIASTMNWQLDAQTTAGFNSFISSNCFGVDRSSLIQNASFDTNHNTEGWILTANKGATLNIGWGNETTKNTPEVYQGNADNAVGGTISQTVTVPVAGVYKVSVNAFYRSLNNAELHTAGANCSVAYLQANNNKVRIGDIYYSLDDINTLPSGPANANDAFFANGKYLNEVYVYVPEESKTIAITLGVPSHNATGWLVFNNFKLTYIVDASAVISKANTLKGHAMEASAKTELTTAISTFESASDQSSYDDLENAIVAAEKSAALYTKIAEAITIVKAKDNNSTLASTLDTKYNNGTYTSVNEVYADYYAYKTPNVSFTAGADLTDALLFNAAGNKGTSTTVESWTCNNAQGFHVNTWSVEGNAGNDPSGMTTPFIENWVAKGSLLGDATIAHPTITNLTPGVYRVAGLMRVYSESGDDPSGVSIYANSASKDILANGTSFTYNNMKGVYAQMEVTTEVGDDGILNVGYTINNATFNWLSFKNFTLTYVSAVITEEDANALIATAPTTAAMNADVKTALTNAVSALQNERNFTNYNALVAAISDANLSAAAYAAAKKAIDKAKAAVAETNFYTTAAKSTWDDLISNYEVAYTDGTWTNEQANAIDVAIWGQRRNANRNDGALNTLLRSVWNVMDSNTWSTEFDTEGSPFTTPFFEYWTSNNKSLGTKTFSATMTGLPEGVYTISALVRTRRTDGNSETPAGITMEGSNGVSVDVANGTLTDSYYLDTFSANAIVRADGQLTVTFSVLAGNNISWFTFKNLKYEAVADASSLLATAEDYTALNSALSSKALGFDEGEYAPFTAEFIAAKNINQTADNLKAFVNAATTAVNNATANTTEVNAFYDGDFSECAEDETTPLDYTPNGWTASSNMRKMLKSDTTNPGLAEASATSAMMSWSGGITYGETAGYEMPLKANSIYRLTFKAAGWNNESRSGITVSVLKDGIYGMEALNLGTPDKDIIGNAQNTAGMTSYEVLFVTGEAGNYVFHVQSGNNFVITDFELKKAASQTLTLKEDGTTPKYAAGTYPEVTLDRTFSSEKWNTLCVPFAFAKSNFKAVKVLSSVAEAAGDVNMTFADPAEETVAAGTPCLVKATNNGDGLSVENVALNPSTTAQTKTVGDATKVNFIGTFTGENLTSANSNAWVVSNNSLYNVDSNVTVGAYRAYFTVETAGAVKALNFNFGTATGIEAINGETVENGTIFNLAGQRVQKAQRGLYIVNGKKVIVK